MKNLLLSFTLFAIVTVTLAVRPHMGPTDVTRVVEMLEMGFPQCQVADIQCVTEHGHFTMVPIPGDRAVYQALWARSLAL